MTIYLTEEDYEQLIAELDKAPEPNEKLKELFARKDVFGDTNANR